MPELYKNGWVILMLTGKQRAQLRAMANSFETILLIGKGGVGETILRQADDALECRELIKCGVLETSPTNARQTADRIAEQVGADVVQVIGSKFILYRPSVEHKKIHLVSSKKNV